MLELNCNTSITVVRSVLELYQKTVQEPSINPQNETLSGNRVLHGRNSSGELLNILLNRFLLKFD